jgi:hypothetical protein
MRSISVSLVLVLAAAVVFAAAPDSYVIRVATSTYTNGAPVFNKGLKARLDGDFFWFRRNGVTYVTRDARILGRAKRIIILESIPQTDIAARQIEISAEQMRIAKEQRERGEFNGKERGTERAYRQNELAIEQNQLAQRANALAARHPSLAELSLKDLGTLADEAIRNGVAARER